MIITKDEDFAGRVRQSPNSPVIIWLRIGNIAVRVLLDDNLQNLLIKENSTWKGSA